MSSALAIAAVTASLKDLLNDGLMDHDLSTVGSFTVTAQPPDRIATGGAEANTLNLFLYQISPNSGWRNVGLPARDRDGARIGSPPLAIDLHYLLSAYGSQDLNAEVLLGYAMQVLHDTPVLTRQQLRTSLATPAPVDGALLPGPFGTLSALDLADQVELIKLTPVFLNAEDLSKLWTAMQARYRPSMAYTVSVVLIQSEGSARAALPVLKRGPDDRGPVAKATPPAVLAAVRASRNALQPALRLGDDLVIEGSSLVGGPLRFECVRAGALRELIATPVDATRIAVHLPSVAEDASGMAGWAIGVYSVSLRLSEPGVPTRTTNAVAMALSPLITVAPLSHAAGTVNLTVTCTPRLRREQETGARLLLGDREIAPSSTATPADPTQPTTLSFAVPGVAAGQYVARLRVDGLDSLPISYGPTGKPAFDPQQTVTVT
jgi:hypothetical protein